MYFQQAEKLEKQGKYREAEKLYIAINQPNRAIAMYKQAGQPEQMMRLVKLYHGEHVQDTHAHLAKEMEEAGRFREAEINYISAGEWKSAVNMYRNAEQWEDAYRVQRSNCPAGKFRCGHYFCRLPNNVGGMWRPNKWHICGQNI